MTRRGGLGVAVVLAVLLSALPGVAQDDGDAPDEAWLGEPDYDPWQPFNEKTFAFNNDVIDRYLLKPVSRAWDRVLPDPVQKGLDRAFVNLDMPRRFVNNLLQARPHRAGQELIRFAVNSTIGVAGCFDVVGRFGIVGSDADTGETLGVWGVGPGPYLVLPFLPPFTVRDAIGYGADSALDPVGYVVSIPLAVSLSLSAIRRVNDRSLQPAAFEDPEEIVIDLYSAARNAYLQSRRRAIQDARRDSLIWSGAND